MENNSVPPAAGQVQFESAFNLFKPSMHAVGQNIWTIVGLCLSPVIPLAVFIPLLIFRGVDTNTSPWLSILTVLIGIVFYAYLFLVGLALVYTTLAGARGKHVNIEEAIKGSLPFFWRYLGLSIALLIIHLIALCLLIVPFFFTLRRYLLAPYYMLDKNLGIKDSLHQSAVDSKKYSSYIWGIIGVEFLFGALCIIPILGGVACFVLAIMYTCAPAIRYLQIQSAEKSSTPAVSVAPGNPPMPPVTNPEPPQAPTPPAAPQPPAAPRRPLVQ
jgi:hypothetical protein